MEGVIVLKVIYASSFLIVSDISSRFNKSLRGGHNGKVGCLLSEGSDPWDKRFTREGVSICKCAQSWLSKSAESPFVLHISIFGIQQEGIIFLGSKY